MDSVCLNIRSVPKSSGRSYLQNHRVANGWNHTNKKHKCYRKANLLGVRMKYAMRCCSSAETSDMQCVAGNCDVTTATLSAAAHCCNIQPRPQVQVNRILTPFAHVHMLIFLCQMRFSNGLCCEVFLTVFPRAGWHSGNGLDSHSGGSWFESSPGHIY
jgi:hypothetical protein